ncbi:MAG: hypothetical protein WD716_13080 [Fimbriimonadaceae bacterium]
MPFGNNSLRSKHRRLFSYVLPPILAVVGVYVIVKGEIGFNGRTFRGAEAMLCGVALLAVAVGLLVLNSYRDKYVSEKYGDD